MFEKVKKYLASALVVVCLISFFVTAFGSGSRDVITLAFWGTNKPYETALMNRLSLKNSGIGAEK